LITK
jgi:hypothetical protein